MTVELVTSTLLDSISKFNNLSSTEGAKSKLVQRYITETEEIAESLEPVLEAVVSSQIVLGEDTEKLLKELDVSINEARGILGIWNQTTSKLYLVLECEQLLAKIQEYILLICRHLKSIFQLLEIVSAYEHVEECMQKIEPKCYQDTSDVINLAIADQVKHGVPGSKHLVKISDYLGLSSNMELLMEIASLKMLKTKVAHSEDNREVAYIDHIIDLVNYMQDRCAKKHLIRNIDGVQVPIDICCPLSLEIMSDPVIVASGQTFERAFIQKWLERGFTLCPRTWTPLAHTNLIPNFIVKTLIPTWCEMNKIKYAKPSILDVNHSTQFLVEEDCSAYHSNARFSSADEPELPEKKFDSFLSLSNGFPQNSHLNKEPISCVMSFPESITGTNTDGSLIESAGKNETDSENHIVQKDCARKKKKEVPCGDVRGVGDTASTSNSGEVTKQNWENDSQLTRTWQLPQSSPRSLAPEVKHELSEIEIKVNRLINDLQSSSVDVQTSATLELRLLTKNNDDNRTTVAGCGAIIYLIDLLHSLDLTIQENAVTTLLNLSLNTNNKMPIVNAGVINPLIHVLRTGNQEARANAAAALYSLSLAGGSKALIGESEAIGPLVELLRSDSLQCKKDATNALLSLSLHQENKARLVQAGAVKPLVNSLNPLFGVVDKAVSALANLSGIAEGREAIARYNGIRALVEVIELGSSRGKENAAAALFHLCTDSINGSKFINMAFKEDAVPPLTALAYSGTPRAKEKAHMLLNFFKAQRQRRPKRH